MATFSARVGTGVDDGYGLKDGSGAWNNTGNFVILGAGAAKVGLFRIDNVTIPQGSIINSAKLTFFFSSGFSNPVIQKIYAIDEDDTASFSTDPRGRTKTTANADWSYSPPGGSGYSFDTADFASVVKEVIDRPGWASGNAIGIRCEDNGGSFDLWVDAYEENPLTCALLTIDYTVTSPSSSVSPSSSGSASVSPSSSTSPSSSVSPSSSTTPSPSKSPSSSQSPSASQSPSSSISLSASPSLSPSASQSPSASLSSSASISPSPEEQFAGMKIAKPGINVLLTSAPEDLKFSSEFGTLKYFAKEASNLSFDANTGATSCRGEITHGLGYYPYCEVYVSVYIGSPTGIYEYCPFAGAGASVTYDATYKIDTNKVTVYGEIAGISTSVWHFDFLIFVFKNDLNL